MYFSLGSIPVWPSMEQVMDTMPESFKKTYPSTRCIIDCTELFCQRPSSMLIQSSLYSSYKHHVTYKGLLGIALSGVITFVSQLYPGSISDKEIVTRSGILNQDLWQNGDSIMADRGFIVSDEFEFEVRQGGSKINGKYFGQNPVFLPPGIEDVEDFFPDFLFIFNNQSFSSTSSTPMPYPYPYPLPSIPDPYPQPKTVFGLNGHNYIVMATIMAIMAIIIS